MKPRGSCNSGVWTALALAALARAGLCQPVTVTGQVTETLHGKPVPKATITLRRAATGTPSLSDVFTAATNADGSFHIGNMLDGSYSVTLSAPGFVLPPAPDGSVNPILPFRVKPGEEHTLALQMTPAGVIAGRVVDLEGDPVRGVQVQAMQYVGARNPRTLQARVSTNSNDRGEYRLYGLSPGAYYVHATVNNNNGGGYPSDNEKIRGPRPPTGFMSTFYPSIRDESASAPVRVEPGEELANIDIRLQPEVLYTVRVKMPGAPASETYTLFTLVDRGANRNILNAAAFDTTAEFRSILPGSYMLTGTVRDANGGSAPHSYAHQTVEVRDHDIEMDAPPFTPLFDLTGAVHLDTAAPFSFQKMRIDAQGDPGTYTLPSPVAVMAADGTFVMHNAAQDGYTLLVNVPPGAYLKAIQLGNAILPDFHIDLSDGPAPLTILLATDGGRIKGSVENAAGESAHATVRLYPEGAISERADRIKSTNTNQDGLYQFADIAPGDYRLYAWDSADTRPLRDPDFRKTYAAQSVAVTVAARSIQVLSLKTVTNLGDGHELPAAFRR